MGDLNAPVVGTEASKLYGNDFQTRDNMIKDNAATLGETVTNYLPTVQ
jgi:hypothetical protein